ncbi:outer membrane lipid asymmetry maintenance protein MlaD [Roseitranquillus sediminis]|uniref:outer membrane lipid asymmetry maintenance protein MlaD n=1 Tax=Roseitranquillus sediminis TaxID=2809051 RepID=UPI001D0C91A7|nr:outer membrane lipid asymmetry maintenance protein MlaD [Roseitranquillus sediminis]MBM9595696.1 outer membrane lipid asymmetry maintenance protein MlaD [Roseitranquillus sediminis]
MRENPVEVATGALVVLIAVGFLVYAAQFAGGSGVRAASYPLTASFRSAEGVTVGTDVRLAGVSIGTVTGLALNPETYRADTLFAIDDGVRLPEDTSIAVASEGLLGGTFIEVLPGGSPFDIDPGGEIEDTQSAVSLITLLLRFVTGSEG